MHQKLTEVTSQKFEIQIKKVARCWAVRRRDSDFDASVLLIISKH